MVSLIRLNKKPKSWKKKIRRNKEQGLFFLKRREKMFLVCRKFKAVFTFSPKLGKLTSLSEKEIGEKKKKKGEKKKKEKSKAIKKINPFL